MNIKISFTGLSIIKYIKFLYNKYKEQRVKRKEQKYIEKYNKHIEYEKNAINRLENDRIRYCFAKYSRGYYYVHEEIHYGTLSPSEYILFADVYSIDKDPYDQVYYCHFIKNRSLNSENKETIIYAINKCKNALKMTSDYLKNKHIIYHIFNTNNIIEYRYILYVENDNIFSEGIKIEDGYSKSLFFHTFEDMVKYFNVDNNIYNISNNKNILQSKIRC